MVKFRLYYDKDTEQEWLNQMAAKGWAITGFFCGFYTFGSCEPGEYVYQIDLLHTWTSKSNDYKAFMSDFNIEMVSQWFRWVYLRKKASDGPFLLYTDHESMIGQYTRIRNMFKVFTILELLLLMGETMIFISTGNMIVLFAIVLISALVLGMVRMAFRCNRKILLLRKDITAEEPGQRRTNLLLFSGFLLNVINLWINRFWELPDVVYIALMAVAVVLLAVGIFIQFHRRSI